MSTKIHPTRRSQIVPQDLVSECQAIWASEFATLAEKKRRSSEESPQRVETAQARLAPALDAGHASGFQLPTVEETTKEQRPEEKRESQSPERSAEVQTRPATPLSGDGLLAFDTPADAPAYDHQQQSGKRGLTGFLDAIYIPEMLAGPPALAALFRDKAGNRSNEITLGWDLSEALEKIRRRRKWVYARRRASELKALFFRNYLALGVAFVLCVWVGIGIQSVTMSGKRSVQPTTYSVTSNRVTKPAPVLLPAEVRRSPLGHAVLIHAGDPRSVLLSFCQNTKGGLCEPVELAWTKPSHPAKRYGMFRTLLDLRAIEIRRDVLTGKWVAGDGHGRIRDFPAHERLMSKERIAVEATDPDRHG